MAADLNMANNKTTYLAAPIDANGAVNKTYVTNSSL